MPVEFGVGVDIEQISRFLGIETKSDRFLRTFMTSREIDYCFSRGPPRKHIAGRFAAKEAIVKALGGLSIRGLTLRDIEILNDEFGSPSVYVNRRSDLNIRVEISLSHCEDYAIAFAIAIRGG